MPTKKSAEFEAKDEQPKEVVAPEPVADGPLHTDEPDAGLTSRQRTRLEKRDAVKEFDPDEEKDTSHCDNHPDRESVVVTDGVAFVAQGYCEECAVKYGHAVPSPKE